MEAPTRQHMLAAKRIIRYLKGTSNIGIKYNRNESQQGLIEYTNNDYAGDVDDRKSTSGYLFFLAGGVVS